MKFFSGKLLNVENGNYKSLIFQSKKFDVGLKRYVDCSESIGISEECLCFINNYENFIGENIIVGINVLPTKKGGIFTIATTDVLTLDDLKDEAT